MGLDKKWKKQVFLLIVLVTGILILQTKTRHIENKEEPFTQEEDFRKRKDILIIGIGGAVEGLDAQEVLSDQGVFYTNIDMQAYLGQKITAVLGKESVDDKPVIEAVEQVISAESVLKNIYILEAKEEGLRILYDNYKIWLEGTLDMSYAFEYLADITIQNGRIKSVQLKNQTIQGEVLAVYEDRIELNGYGMLSLSEDFRIYEAYDEPKEVDISRLVVGYDIARFVAADGMLCAGIIEAPPDMTRIRVVLQQTDYQGLFHEEICLVSDCEMTVTNADGSGIIAAGEEFRIQKEDLKENERLILEAAENSGIQVTSILRSQGNPVYQGSLEISRRDEGLLLINELGVEEYLCSVVPSEMPSSYHIEALKAQAVCARSYAYNQIREGRYQNYGAHVDDSVSCQVYNNIPRQERTTRAVYDTAGETAVYKGDVITAYYFSTSSGRTASGEIWGGASVDLPYLRSKEVVDEQGNAYEQEEPWYRWNVEFQGGAYWENVDARVQTLAKASPHLVLVKDDEGNYRQGEFHGLGKIKTVREGERLDGGILNSMYLDGSKASVEIRTEYAIRSVLCEPGSEIIRENSSSIKTGTLLPSGFFDFTITDKDGEADHLTIQGGGYGHGAGMSQNGANQMAMKGKTYKEILQFFYEGIIIE